MPVSMKIVGSSKNFGLSFQLYIKHHTKRTKVVDISIPLTLKHLRRGGTFLFKKNLACLQPDPRERLVYRNSEATKHVTDYKKLLIQFPISRGGKYNLQTLCFIRR